MGHILGAEVVALYSARKTFTFGCTGNVYNLNVSEKIYFQLATNSESFTVVQAEFPQTAAGFDLVKGFAVGRTIFGAVARDWMAGKTDDAGAVAASLGPLLEAAAPGARLTATVTSAGFNPILNIVDGSGACASSMTCLDRKSVV